MYTRRPLLHASGQCLRHQALQCMCTFLHSHHLKAMWDPFNCHSQSKAVGFFNQCFSPWSYPNPFAMYSAQIFHSLTI